MKTALTTCIRALLATSVALAVPTVCAQDRATYASKGSAPSVKPADFKNWVLPAHPPYPKDNQPTPTRVALGKKLFFDPRVSRDGNMSCATCHNPSLGWSDGLATARGFNGQLLGRASPTIINTAYNSIQMWDGRKKIWRSRPSDRSKRQWK